MKRYIKSELEYYTIKPRKYSGRISQNDLNNYGEEYGLPTGEVKMIKMGEWIGYGNRPVGSYQFADGRFTYDDPDAEVDIQFSYDRKTKTFYIETIDKIL
jgi:hypothetical protein